MHNDSKRLEHDLMLVETQKKHQSRLMEQLKNVAQGKRYTSESTDTMEYTGFCIPKKVREEKATMSATHLSSEALSALCQGLPQTITPTTRASAIYGTVMELTKEKLSSL